MHAELGLSTMVDAQISSGVGNSSAQVLSV